RSAGEDQERILDLVSLPPDSDLLNDFRSLHFLNQHDKARYFEKVAEQEGVLHLLKTSQAAATETQSQPEPTTQALDSKINRAKILSLRTTLPISDYGGGSLKVVVRPYGLSEGHGSAYCTAPREGKQASKILIALLGDFGYGSVVTTSNCSSWLEPRLLHAGHVGPSPLRAPSRGGSLGAMLPCHASKWADEYSGVSLKY
ncbi:hypothetical protein FOL47_001577, partial [Perkinsus chesapeaki]